MCSCRRPSFWFSNFITELDVGFIISAVSPLIPGDLPSLSSLADSTSAFKTGASSYDVSMFFSISSMV